jgi:putative serine/threonine protein kinase
MEDRSGLTEFTPVQSLTFEEFGQILCYPRPERDEFHLRQKELKLLGVNAISFTGPTKIKDRQILGKGCVSLVIKAEMNRETVALKIRRVDADRPHMSHESSMLRLANRSGVGPSHRGSTKNLLAMTYIRGLPISRWVETLSGRGQKTKVRQVVSAILTQCFAMDNAGLDHGELSNASKHILVDGQGIPWIIDFESASITRKPNNLTSIVQFLFVNPKMAPLIEKRIGHIDRDALFPLLRSYKKSATQELLAEISRHLGI